MPGDNAINDIVNQIDPRALASALNQWLIAHSDTLPKTLAIDGNDLSGKGQIGACTRSNRMARTTSLAY